MTTTTKGENRPNQAQATPADNTAQTAKERRKAAHKANPLIDDNGYRDTLHNVASAIRELGSVYSDASANGDGHDSSGLYWLLLPLEGALSWEANEGGEK